MWIAMKRKNILLGYLSNKYRNYIYNKIFNSCIY